MAEDMRIGASPAPAPAPQVDGPMWWFIVLSLCAVVVASGFSGLKSGVGGLAYQAGQCLPYAGLTAAALHMVLKRTRVGSKPWLGFILLYAAWLVASGVAVERELQQARLMRSEFSEMLDVAQKSLTASGPIDTSTLARSSKAKGDLATWEMLVKGMAKRGLDLRQEYEAELTRVGLGRLLDGRRIKQDKSMAETRAIVNDVRRLATNYRHKNLAVFDELSLQIDAAPINDEYRRGLKVGAERGVQTGREFAMRSWDLEQQLIEMLSEIAEMLGASRARWQMQGENFVFARKSDLDEFNLKMANFDRLSQVQLAATETRMREVREKLDKLP